MSKYRVEPDEDIAYVRKERDEAWARVDKLEAERKVVFPLDALVWRLIYGDIEAVSLEVLGADCPSQEAFNSMNDEQKTRLAAAATVVAWFTSCAEREVSSV